MVTRRKISLILKTIYAIILKAVHKSLVAQILWARDVFLKKYLG